MPTTRQKGKKIVYVGYVNGRIDYFQGERSDRTLYAIFRRKKDALRYYEDVRTIKLK